ncbi:hypothetical protein ABIB45_004133 [Arthrobacter sp. UYCo732]
MCFETEKFPDTPKVVASGSLGSPMVLNSCECVIAVPLQRHGATVLLPPPQHVLLHPARGKIRVSIKIRAAGLLHS